MKTDASLADLQKMIRKFVDDRDWDQFHNPKDPSIPLALEAAEAWSIHGRRLYDIYT